MNTTQTIETRIEPNYAAMVWNEDIDETNIEMSEEEREIIPDLSEFVREEEVNQRYNGIIGVGAVKTTHHNYGSVHHVTVDKLGIVSRLIPGRERARKYAQRALAEEGVDVVLEDIKVKKEGRGPFGLWKTVVGRDHSTIARKTEKGYQVRLLKAVENYGTDDEALIVEFTPESKIAKLANLYGKITGEVTDSRYDFLQEAVGKIIRSSLGLYVARDATRITHERGNVVAHVPAKWLYGSVEEAQEHISNGFTQHPKNSYRTMLITEQDSIRELEFTNMIKINPGELDQKQYKPAQEYSLAA